MKDQSSQSWILSPPSPAQRKEKIIAINNKNFPYESHTSSYHLPPKICISFCLKSKPPTFLTVNKMVQSSRWNSNLSNISYWKKSCSDIIWHIFQINTQFINFCLFFIWSQKSYVTFPIVFHRRSPFSSILPSKGSLNHKWNIASSDALLRVFLTNKNAEKRTK